MAHKDWCGKPCGKCTMSCQLDESMACLPDCKALNGDGTRNAQHCREADCDAYVDEEGRCPSCGCDNLEYSDAYLSDGMYVYEWECECGTTGKETYNLTFVTQMLD